MHPLVAVEESENLPPEPECHGLGCPRKAQPWPALTPGGEDDRLLKRPERNGDLEHDPVLLELASSSQVRTRPVAKRLDDHLVVSRPRQTVEDAPRIGV